MQKGLIALLSVLAVSGQTFYSAHVREDHCNPGLLASYDLEVIRTPTNQTNFICPGVENNCCTTDSQLRIFRKWIQGNERAKLLHVYKTFIATFALLFDDFKLVESMAEAVLNQKPADQVTNCGNMATAIRSLKASSLKESVLTQAKRAYRYLYDARRGFYCSLCDADAHNNYNSLDGAIHMSYGFCSGLVKETIGWTSFVNEAFPKISRLYGHFLSTCSTNGKYENVNVLKDHLKFFVNREFKQDIQNCIKNVNDASAIGLCYDYCNHFNPAKFSRMFEGQFETFLAFRVWMNKLVVSKIMASLKGFSKDDLSFTGRLLSEAKTDSGSGSNAKTDSTADPAPQPTPAPADDSPINEFNTRYSAQALEPVTYSASEDFRPARLFDYHSSLFVQGKDKIYNIADFRRIISTSGINFLTYGYMLKITPDTLAKLDAQHDLETEAQFANVTDIFSANYGYRNSSVQIIS